MSDANVVTKPTTTKPALLKGVPTSDAAPMQTLMKMSNICNPIVASTAVILVSMLLVNGLVVHYEPMNPMNVYKDTDGNSLATDRTTGGLLHVATTTTTNVDFAGLFSLAEDDLHECKESIQNVQYVVDAMEVDADVEGMVFVSDLPVANSTATEDALFLRTSISDVLVYESGAYKVLDERWDARKASLPVGAAGSRRRLAEGATGSASGRRQLARGGTYSNVRAFLAASRYTFCESGEANRFDDLDGVLDAWRLAEDELRLEEGYSTRNANQWNNRATNVKKKLIRLYAATGGRRSRTCWNQVTDECWAEAQAGFAKNAFYNNVEKFLAGGNSFCDFSEDANAMVDYWAVHDYNSMCNKPSNKAAYVDNRKNNIKTKLIRNSERVGITAGTWTEYVAEFASQFSESKCSTCMPWCSDFCDGEEVSGTWCLNACSNNFKNCKGCEGGTCSTAPE